MAQQDCQVTIPTDLLDGFEADKFENTVAIEWMHAWPRLGHGRDVLKLMQGSEDEQRDYIMGLLASSLTLGMFYLIWLFILLAFKSLGPSQAGLLSGRIPKFPPRPASPKGHNSSSFGWANQSEEVRRWERRYQRARWKLRILRILVGMAGVCIIISSIVLSLHG